MSDTGTNMSITRFNKLTSKFLLKFFEKKNLPHKQWQIHRDGHIHVIDNHQIISMILSAKPEVQTQIAESLQDLDVLGKNINKFLENLAVELMSTE